MRYINILTKTVESVNHSVISRALPHTEDLFVSPPWIDFHSHAYHGVTTLGLRPDDIGLRTGVHLLVDAGSAGEGTLRGLTEYIVPASRTKIKAFINISSIGLVTLHEYNDIRHLDVKKAAECVTNNRDVVAGIKVRSSGSILEGRGTLPLRLAIEAAEMADCPVMVHFGETPPSNEENLALLRDGDIITHCFHGKDSPLWNDEGKPIPALEAALARGVLLDVGHGAASLCKNVAGSVVATKMYDFTISTDLHARNVTRTVISLPHTMTKFLALGMPLADVVRAVTQIPSERLGLSNWCDDIEQNATIFRLKRPTTADAPFTDAHGAVFSVDEIIEPVGVVVDGELTLF